MNPRRDQTRRKEHNLQIWILEAKGMPSKKNYFCEICLDKTLYARTSAKGKGEKGDKFDICFFGEYFDFSLLPKIEDVCINLYREADPKKRKDRTTLVGYILIKMDQLISRHPVERWYTVKVGSDASTGNKLTSNWVSRSSPAEAPSIRIKARFQSVDILPKHIYEHFVYFLQDNYLPLCLALEPLLSVKAKEDFAISMVKILHKQSTAKEFLCDLIMSEVDVLDNEHLMFRGNSLATKAMEGYMKLVADDYLQETLGDFIKMVFEGNDNCEVDSMKLPSSSTNLLERNRQQLVFFCEAAWSKIIASLKIFPQELKEVFELLRKRLTATSRAELADNLISSSIFLRFLCPAILSPSLFSLISEYPNPQVSRNLTLIAKTMQTLANFNKFGGKEHYMEFMNEFVTREWDNMQSFLLKISTHNGNAYDLRRNTAVVNNNLDVLIDSGKELSLLHQYLEETWNDEIHNKATLEEPRLFPLRNIILEISSSRNRDFSVLQSSAKQAANSPGNYSPPSDYENGANSYIGKHNQLQNHNIFKARENAISQENLPASSRNTPYRSKSGIVDEYGTSIIGNRSKSQQLSFNAKGSRNSLTGVGSKEHLDTLNQANQTSQGYFEPRQYSIYDDTLEYRVLTCGVFYAKTEDDLRFLYSPDNSPSRFEYQIHKEFSGDSTNQSYIAIAVESITAAGNILENDIMNEILNFNMFVKTNMTYELDGKILNTNSSFCHALELCRLGNAQIEIFFSVMKSDKLRKDPRVILEYPMLQFFENKFFLPSSLYGITPGGEKGIKSVEMAHLIFFVGSVDNHSSDEVSIAVEKSIRNYLHQNTTHIRYSIFSLSILKDEMQKNTTYTFPYISLTVFLLLVFTCGSSMTGDWITSKPIEALMGFIVSSMAIMSSSGILFFLGVPFINQVTVMPFLAFTIGVDDTYVMLGAWQDTKRTLSPSKRMALSLEEAGTAISVTSLTSIISFSIGTFSTTPAISIFCKFISLAIFFDWFYQITLFAGVMALGGKREGAGYHCILATKKMSDKEIAHSKSANFISPTHNFFANKMAPFLCTKYVRIFFICIYFVYIYLAFYGCSLLTPDLTPSRLLVDDSPLTHYLEKAESKIWSEGVIGRVYVNNAPDLSREPEKAAELLQMVADLESTEFSIGSNSTQLWIRDFDNYKQYFLVEQETYYQILESFLKVSFNSQWKIFLKWDDNPNRPGKLTTNSMGTKYVKRFFFTTAYKIKDWNVRTKLLLKWRNITSSYPQFQALVFDENNFYSDQLLELKDNTLNSLGTVVIALICVLVLFIGDTLILFIIISTLVTMDIGVSGFLSLWGAELDPGFVVTLFMAIGLSIDYSSHVAYKIYRTVNRNPDKRISEALGAIGWPVVQAGVSTIISVLSMGLVNSNSVRSFAKTNILVVFVGIFHGLFILPILIRTFASDVTEQSSIEMNLKKENNYESDELSPDTGKKYNNNINMIKLD
uniref:Ras-GAP domain-containing protein n=1 Tax=Rhabditophanes sp. KR3021 TaxID=114890 RepID=A0AC35UIK1_9BILA